MGDAVLRFELGKGNKKYTAVLIDGSRVSFGDKRFQQYEDRVPLKAYSHLDHKDERRRASYRKRHAGIKVRAPGLPANGVPFKDIAFTPAWFSWNYLW